MKVGDVIRLTKETGTGISYWCTPVGTLGKITNIDQGTEYNQDVIVRAEFPYYSNTKLKIIEWDLELDWFEHIGDLYNEV